MTAPQNQDDLKAAVEHAIQNWMDRTYAGGETFRPEDMRALWRDAVEHAVTSWMEKQFIKVGKWTLTGLAIGTFGVVVYIILIRAGWSPPTDAYPLGGPR